MPSPNHRPCPARTTVAALLLYCLVALSNATGDLLSVPRVDANITVGGKLDEALWRQATQVQFLYQIQPGG